METETKVSLTSRDVRSHQLRVKMRILYFVYMTERRTKGYGAYQSFLIEVIKSFEDCSDSYVIDLIKELQEDGWLTIGQKGARIKIPVEIEPFSVGNGRIKPYVLTQKARNNIQYFTKIMNKADELWHMYQEAEEIIG